MRSQELRGVITRREFAIGIALLASPRIVRGADPSLNVTGLDHVNIRAADVRRSAEFYAKLFGVEVSRAASVQANPGSVPGESWFVKLGESSLTISPLSPGEAPGIDHYCLAIDPFEADVIRRSLTGMNQQWPDSPPTWLWLADPSGNIVQLVRTRTDAVSRRPGSGVGAVPVELPGSVARPPVFKAGRIAHVTLAVRNIDECVVYYQRLLRTSGRQRQATRFRFKTSSLFLEPSSAPEHFCIEVIGFARSAALEQLSGAGVKASIAKDEAVVEFHDPDGIKVQVGPGDLN